MRYSKLLLKNKLAKEEEFKKGDFVEFIEDFDADAGADLKTPMEKGYKGSVTAVSADSDIVRVFINNLNREEEVPKKYLTVLTVKE